MGSRLWEGAAEQHDGDLSPLWASSSGLRAPGALGTLRIARPSPRSISGKRDLSVRGRRSPAQNCGSPQASGPSLTRKLEAAPGARSISGQRRDGHEGQGHGHGVRPAAGTVGMDGARLTNTNPKIVEVKSTFLSFFLLSRCRERFPSCARPRSLAGGGLVWSPQFMAGFLRAPPGQAVPSGLKLHRGVFMCCRGSTMTDNPKQLQSEIGEADMGTIPQSRRGAPARLPDIKGRAGPAAAPCPRPAPPRPPTEPQGPLPTLQQEDLGQNPAP